MARNKEIDNSMTLSIRFNRDLWNMIQQIAVLESERAHKLISGHELIRRAVEFMYDDNERMRECFKRTRKTPTRKRINYLSEM